jgi:16S rRNA (guanine527-N7)-methyltransferase
LRAGIAELKLGLPEPVLATLLRHLELLRQWNRVYNLTAIREEEKWLTHHVLDSLSVITRLPPGDVVDVGSGGGFPGIPIAAACSERKVCLLDSNHKKGAFLLQAVNELGLNNARVEIQRVESFQPEERFNVVISRAFAELADFARCAVHLCAPGGRMIAMKGVYPHEEISQVPASAVEKIIRLSVPRMDAERHLVFIDPVRLRSAPS